MGENTAAAAALQAQAPSAAGAFRVVPNSAPLGDEARAAALTDLKFGTQFTDHMVRMTWTNGGGWDGRRV
ncbi:MAG: branched chain amino acid aminotransferase, partial [Demequinaceae bacterium]|nr:branched chain amino acid aminotransferase [Demequinaceae bacterium]